MVKARLSRVVIVLALAVGALAYLRDPFWLINQTTGLRTWEQPPGEPRYRWSGGHASFFVRSDAGIIEVPISTTFDARDDRPMLVTFSIDDKLAARAVLSQAGWTRVRLTLPPPGSRRVRRIDVRTSPTRESNHGVRIGDIVTTR
jgi:hypothetical protein